MSKAKYENNIQGSLDFSKKQCTNSATAYAQEHSTSGKVVKITEVTEKKKLEFINQIIKSTPSF